MVTPVAKAVVNVSSCSYQVPIIFVRF